MASQFTDRSNSTKARAKSTCAGGSPIQFNTLTPGAGIALARFVLLAGTSWRRFENDEDEDGRYREDKDDGEESSGQERGDEHYPVD
jgi:hypothetical protein